MIYGSVCSGIEAATVAWHPLGWKPAFFSEIEKFPSAVLSHHYPDVPNRGDMTKFKEWPDAKLDVLVGGTPCQSFSVAGLRKGLDDPRGNLMLTYLAIAARYRPTWLVWENVPGVLSSNRGKDFGTFLGGLAELGYGFAYRVLDAQHFGIPQRRRRVFVVGCIGDWRRAAAVLFERHSLSGDTPPSREKGKGFAHDTAPCLTSSGRGVERSGDTRGQDPVYETETLIAHSLRGEGFDASEDGTGRGTPLVPVAYRTAGDGCVYEEGDRTAALTTGTDPSANIIGFAQNQRDEVRMMHVAGALAAEPGMKQQTYIAQPIGLDEEQNAMIDAFGTLKARTAGGGFEGSVMQPNMQVRRLTPRECERLRGFPDDYSLIPLHQTKPSDALRFSADGPRYKALGNSMAVPVMRWIGSRIDAVQRITSIQKQEAA